MTPCTAHGKGWACDKPGPLCAGHRKQKSRGEKLTPLKPRRHRVEGLTAQTYELTAEEHAGLLEARTKRKQSESEFVRDAIRTWLETIGTLEQGGGR